MLFFANLPACRRSWLIILGGFFFGLQVPRFVEAAPVAEIIGLHGRAEVRRIGATTFSPAGLLQKLWPQEACRTLAHSKAKLFFLDQTILVLGEETTIEVGDYLVGSATSSWRRHLKLVAGRLRLLVSRFTGQDPEMTLDLPTLTVAVRGTDAIFASRPTEDLVYLFQARKPLRLRHKITGQTVDLPVGFWAISRREGPIEIKPLSPQLRQELLQELNLFFEVRPRPIEPNHLDSNQGYAPIQPEDFTKPGVMPVYQPPVPQPPRAGERY